MTPDQRTLDQNAKLHAMLTDISNQVTWAGFKFDKDEWKKIIMGALYDQIVVPNPFRHGVVVLNKQRTRDLRKSPDRNDPSAPNMMDVMNELQAWGDGEGVVWSDPEWQAQLREYSRVAA